MDVFFEQLVKIPKNGKTIALSLLMWLAGILMAVVIVLAVVIYAYSFLVIGVAAAFGVLYLCFKWTSNFSCEFEYIFTNGDLDIDKIIAKQKRERKVTLDMSAVEKIGRFDANIYQKAKYDKRVIACVPDNDSIYLIARHKKEGVYLLVFAPEERLMAEMKKFIPRNILRESEI